MNPILWAATWMGLGAVLGALARCFIDDRLDSTLWPVHVGRQSFKAIWQSAISMTVLGMVLPFIPPEEVAKTVPWVGGAIGKLLELLQHGFAGAVLGALLAYSGVNLTGAVKSKIPSALRDDTQPPGKMPMVLLAISLAGLAGCSALGYQSTTISIPRDPTLIAYGEARMLYKLGAALLEMKCAPGPVPQDQLLALLCQAGSEAKLKAQFFDQTIQTALQKKDNVSPEDGRKFLAAAGEVVKLGVSALATSQAGPAGAAGANLLDLFLKGVAGAVTR